MPMQVERTIMASKFKAQCLALLDQVAIDHVPIVVTKRGQPIARVVPIGEISMGRSTAGSVRLLAGNDEDFFSTGEGWDLIT